MYSSCTMTLVGMASMPVKMDNVEVTGSGLPYRIARAGNSRSRIMIGLGWAELHAAED